MYMKIQRLYSLVRQAIDDYNLIEDGEIIVLQKDALNYVALIEKQAVGEHEANFTEFYKALFVFGAMIARPKSIVRIAAAE